MTTADELRVQIKALPDDAKAELAKVWPRKRDGSKVPGLGTSHEHTVTELELIEQAIVSVTPFDDEPGPDPERVAELMAKLKSLPTDLQNEVDLEAHADGVPNLRSPNLELRHLNILDGLLEQALGKHFDRVLRAGAAVDLIDGDTALLEALCTFVTGYATSDPNDLTHEQARDLEAATRLIAHGALDVTETNGGKPQVSLAIDWKEEAKRQGVTQRDLLDRAKALAEKHGLKPPKNLPGLSPFLTYELLLEGDHPVVDDMTPDEVAEAIQTGQDPGPAIVNGAVVPDVSGKELGPGDVVAFVEEVRRRPGIQAAQVVIRVPAAFADSLRDRLYVRSAS